MGKTDIDSENLSSVVIDLMETVDKLTLRIEDLQHELQQNFYCQQKKIELLEKKFDSVNYPIMIEDIRDRHFSFWKIQPKHFLKRLAIHHLDSDMEMLKMMYFDDKPKRAYPIIYDKNIVKFWNNGCWRENSDDKPFIKIIIRNLHNAYRSFNCYDPDCKDGSKVRKEDTYIRNGNYINKMLSQEYRENFESALNEFIKNMYIYHLS